MALTLYTVLRRACPSGLRVLAAPFAVRTALINEVQPDVLAARYDDLTEANTKKAHYERLGVASYWLLDPVQPGGLEVYELDEHGRYQLTAAVSGDEVFAARRPFPVQVCPARLLDGARQPVTAGRALRQLQSGGTSATGPGGISATGHRGAAVRVAHSPAEEILPHRVPGSSRLGS